MKPKEQSQFESIVEKHGLTPMDFLISVRSRKPAGTNVVPLFGRRPEVHVECLFTGRSQSYIDDPAAHWLEDFERDLNAGRF